MTAVNERLKNFADFCRIRKDDTAKEAKTHDEADITPALEIWRDGNAMALILCNRVNRDDALRAVLVAGKAMLADELILVNDAHVTKQMVNPATGERWGPGEMQKACDEDGACSTGLITDCLMVLRANRNGEMEGYNMPYHLHTDGTVAWQEPTHMAVGKGGVSLAGLVPDTMRDALGGDAIIETERLNELAELDGISPLEARVRADFLCIQMLMETGNYQAILTTNDPEYAAIFDTLSAEKMSESVNPN